MIKALNLRSFSMGTAWASAHSYPWEHGYVGGIETVKVNIMLRIYSNKWHVYAGLAILNPAARVQIDQYARSTREIFKLMLANDEEGLRSRIYAARDKVFGPTQDRAPILLSEDVLDKFSLAKRPQTARTSSTDSFSGGNCPSPKPKENSHLSLLAMVDCWANLSIQPFVHLDLAATPIFRMWIGVAEYLFRHQDRLDTAINAALHELSHRSDDLEFVVAAVGWSRCVSYGSFGLYKQRFHETEEFFESRFEEATKVGTAMIKAIMDSSPQT